MRWKLLRRRLSVSAPRVTVRSHLPWPLRWIAAALVLGFSAALAMWAFEFGKGIAGLDRGSEEELAQLRVEVERLRADNQRLASVANTADSLLTAERAAQEKLGQTVRQLESEAQELKNSVAFFERLLRADIDQPGSVRFQMLVMQSGKDPVDFSGRYEVSASGVIGNRPWTSPSAEWASGDFKLRQYTRVEGALSHPPEVTLRSLQVRLLDAKQNVRATHTHRF
jgi:hypothetical protein